MNTFLKLRFIGPWWKINTIMWLTDFLRLKYELLSGGSTNEQ